MPVPNRNPEGALIRVTMAGICNTDLEIARGYMGFRGVLGHELVGVVAAGRRPAGRQARRRRDQPRVRDAATTCARGLGRHCPARRVLGIVGKDGAFAEYVTLPVANLHVVPDGSRDERAVFVEPLAAAFEILEQVRMSSRARTQLVLGDGKLGLLIAQVLQRAGARVTAVGKHERKLGLAARAASARRCSTSCGRSVRPRGRGHRHAGRPRAGGRAQRGRAAPWCSRARPRRAPALTSRRSSIDEISVVGSRCGPFERAIAGCAFRLADHSDAMVDAVVPLAQAEAAFEHAARPGVLKSDMKS